MGLALQKLTASERANIARELFQVDEGMSTDEELRGLCPIHNEENPSFGYNVEKDAYHCLACGASGDLIKLWTKIKGYNDNREGFKAFCEQHGIDANGGQSRRHAADKRPSGKEDASGSRSGGGSKAAASLPDLEDVLKLLPPLPDKWIERLERTRGWSLEVIERMDLRLQTHYQAKKTGKLHKLKRPERIAIPVRDEHGICRNIRLYKPGGDPKIISWGAKYGSARLLPAAPDPDGVVLLCEGESDTLCALSHGFNAITQTTKPRKWRREHLESFRDRDVVIAYDADQAGQKYIRFSASNLVTVAGSVRVLEWPDWMGRQEGGSWPQDHGQDLTDFFVNHRKAAEDLQALIDAAEEYSPPLSMDGGDAGVNPYDFFDRGVNDRLSFKPRLLAEWIMKDMALLSDTETGLFYRWNDRFWERYHDDHIKAMALRYLGNEADKGRAENAAYQVQKLSTIPHGRRVNDRDDWICLQNGMFNLRTCELKPHARDYFCTFELNVKYNPDSGELCKRWIRFLRETVQTPEVIMQLQEFAGCCLTRESRFAKCLLLIGPGADGKSTFLKLLRQLVGPENCASVSFQDLEDQFQRSALYNKLLNISTEVGAKAIESPYFKAITSSDPINAAFKHKNPFDFIPHCKLAFAANKLPRVLDNSDGFYRRVLPVKFKRQFREGDPDTDPDLEDKLMAELSEIFHWALVGLHRLWKQKHFTDSAETREMMNTYRRLNNPVICFVEDQCVLREGESIAKRELYSKYVQYCNQNRYTPLNRENFFRELYTAINNLKQYRPTVDGKRVLYIQGIGLNLEFGSQ